MFTGILLTSQGKKYSKESKDYFLEIAFGTEYGDSKLVIKKWIQYIKIHIKGDVPVFLKIELDKILKELNQLTGRIKLHIVPTRESANLTVFFGTPEEYVTKIEPNAEDFIKDNWGIFWGYWNQNYEIVSGSIFVNTIEPDHIQARHLLRETITESLGLLNESTKYKKSIFYKDWSDTTKYIDIDRES